MANGLFQQASWKWKKVGMSEVLALKSVYFLVVLKLSRSKEGDS